MLLLICTLLNCSLRHQHCWIGENNHADLLVVSSALLIAQSNGIYKKWPCNFLEAFFHAQLIVFAAGVAYVVHNSINVTIVADSSIGVAVIVCWGITSWVRYIP